MLKRYKVIFITALFVSRLAIAQDRGFQYAAKVICGSPPAAVLAPGAYYTAINIHNPLETGAEAKWKVAVAFSGDKPGPISKFVPLRLEGDGAIEINCREVQKLSGLGTSFLKGFVVIESRAELDVIGVYTAAGASKQVESLDIERVPMRRTVAGCADLIVDSINKPVWDEANKRSVIQATIKNVGRAAAPASIARVVDPTTLQSTGAPYNAIAATQALVPGQSTTVTFYLPYWVYNPDVMLEVTADYKSQVDECDETNNTKVFKGIG